MYMYIHIHIHIYIYIKHIYIYICIYIYLYINIYDDTSSGFQVERWYAEAPSPSLALLMGRGGQG